MSGTDSSDKVEPGTGDCICTIQWRKQDDPEGFTWYYKTECSVDLRKHTCHREMFSAAVDGGFGFGQDPNGGRIVINDGKVSCPFCVKCPCDCLTRACLKSRRGFRRTGTSTLAGIGSCSTLF